MGLRKVAGEKGMGQLPEGMGAAARGTQEADDLVYSWELSGIEQAGLAQRLSSGERRCAMKKVFGVLVGGILLVGMLLALAEHRGSAVTAMFTGMGI